MKWAKWIYPLMWAAVAADLAYWLHPLQFVLSIALVIGLVVSRNAKDYSAVMAYVESLRSLAAQMVDESRRQIAALEAELKSAREGSSKTH